MNMFNKHGHNIKSKGPWPGAVYLEQEGAEPSIAVELLIGCPKLEGTWGKGRQYSSATETLQLSKHVYMNPHVQEKGYTSAEQQLRRWEEPCDQASACAHTRLQVF